MASSACSGASVGKGIHTGVAVRVTVGVMDGSGTAVDVRVGLAIATGLAVGNGMAVSLAAQATSTRLNNSAVKKHTFLPNNLQTRLPFISTPMATYTNIQIG